MNVNRDDRQLLRLVTQARSRREIARRMRLDESDVDHRLQRVLRQLRGGGPAATRRETAVWMTRSNGHHRN